MSPRIVTGRSVQVVESQDVRDLFRCQMTEKSVLGRGACRGIRESMGGDGDDLHARLAVGTQRRDQAACRRPHRRSGRHRGR